jgi:hypothetical protein
MTVELPGLRKQLHHLPKPAQSGKRELTIDSPYIGLFKYLYILKKLRKCNFLNFT